GVRGLKPDPGKPLDLIDQAQEIRKIRPFFHPKIKPVTVYVLPQKGDLFNPLGGQTTDLVENLLRTAAFFPPADIWNNTISAEIVTPVNHRDPRAEGTFPCNR